MGALRGDDSLADLLGQLAVVEEQVRAAVAARRAVDPEPDDAFRGLYLSDEHIDVLLRRGVPQTGARAPLDDAAHPDGFRDAGEPEDAGEPGDAGHDGAGEPDAPDAVDATRSRAASEELARRVENAAAAARQRGSRLRLRELARRCGLTDLDVHILLVALAPDLDPRFEKLYGYLHDDVTRRRASPGLALELSGRSPFDQAARARCTAGGPLVAAGLLVVEDVDRPFLTRSLRVPDRLTGHLLGDDRAAPALAGALVDAPDVGGPQVEWLARVVAAVPGPDEAPLVHLRTASGGDALAVAVSAARRAGRPFVALDLRVGAARLAGTGEVGAGAGGGAAPTEGSGARAGDRDDTPGAGAAAWLVRAAVREARLAGAVLVIGPAEAIDAGELAAVVAAATPGGPVPPVPVVLHGRAAWDPQTPGPVARVADVHPLGAAEQAAVWAAELGDVPVPAELALLRLTPSQMRRAVAGAWATARDCETETEIETGTGTGIRAGAGGLAGARPVPDAGRLVAAAREQNATGLERLARRVSPAVGWDDLVLPPRTFSTLRHLAGRAAHRGRVLDDWGLRRGGNRGEAVTALFVGESGTGKTMAAEVVAGALGVDLYVIDLSTVVDKYIGETEKNLERIFVGAEGLNAVLFFDEADALFGKRSEVSDARDRYANVEVAYLLQRIESFDGVAILATNLAANLDDAFRRRLSVVAEFVRPDAEQRLALWQRTFAGVPLTTGVDLEFCAKAFGLAGGDIRNAAVTAAYLGAADGQVNMREVITAVGLEYRKLGRLCLADEFGPYFDLLSR
ncbi:ATP-binding protein [Frankia gtarii]|uniref:ATP-binding protein n=1 Tax=Frankia gtarii TaxID=2950102 RepID=UPI0021BEE8E5|nr:ATP-binding protein [Frankia gtarii]